MERLPFGRPERRARRFRVWGIGGGGLLEIRTLQVVVKQQDLNLLTSDLRLLTSVKAVVLFEVVGGRGRSYHSRMGMELVAVVVDRDGETMLKKCSRVVLVSVLFLGLGGCIDGGGFSFSCEDNLDCLEGYSCVDISGGNEEVTLRCMLGPGAENGSADGDSETPGDSDSDSDGETDSDGDGDESLEGWALIPSGTYLQGSPEGEEDRYFAEGPQREVTITREFYLKSTPVTQGEWEVLMGTEPPGNGGCGDDCPVVSVNWWSALAYGNALSQADDYERCYELADCNGTPGVEGYSCGSVTFAGLDCTGYRLPTEAEWEYALRAGSLGPRYGEIDAIAWYVDNSDGSIKPVGLKEPNNWGLYDMLGNVAEWTWDWYDENAYRDGNVTDPLGPPGPVTGTLRVYRGCSAFSTTDNCRAAVRGAVGPANRRDFVGFRLARSVP